MIENTLQLTADEQHLVETFAPMSFVDPTPEPQPHRRAEYVVPAAEFDPTGRGQHAPGSKVDGGKPRASLIFDGFANALLEVAKLGTFGAQKYSDDGWKQVPNGVQRYSDAMLRHYLYEQRELIDPDSGLLHAVAVAWNALARLELMLVKEF